MIDTTYFKKVRFLVGEFSSKALFIVFMFIMSSVLEVVGIGLIAPFIAMIMDMNTFVENDIYLYLVSFGFVVDNNNLLIFFSIVLVTVFLLKTVFIILINYINLKFCNGVELSLRSSLLRNFQKMAYVDYLNRSSSEYIHSISHLASEFSQGSLLSILRVISETIILVFIIVFLFIQSPIALSILVVLVVVVAVLYDFIFKEKLHKYGKSINKHSIGMTQGIQETSKGFKEIRVLGIENYFYTIVDNHSALYVNSKMASQVISLIPRYALELILVLFIVSIVIVSIYFEQDVSSIFPTISVFGIASIRLIPSVNLIVVSINIIRTGRNSVSILYKDMHNIQNDKNKSFTDESGDCKEGVFKYIELSNVSFKYANSKKPILHNLSIRIDKGQSIGITGSSGSGKSTFVDLLLGLIEPDKGEIYYNGNKVSNSGIWMSQVAYLPQNIFIVDDTIRNNIALGVNNEEIDDNKINNVIKSASLDDLIKSLPNGIYTRLGENGVRLSGGQKQRIAIARAFYHNRNVLIMDESTSALDKETESEIVREINLYSRSKTVIVIAHRESTINNCDKVFKIENGMISENITI